QTVRHRGQRGELPAECWPDGKGGVSAGERGTTAPDGAVDGGERGGDLRDGGGAVWDVAMGTVHGQDSGREHDPVPDGVRLANRRQTARRGAGDGPGFGEPAGGLP